MAKRGKRMNERILCLDVGDSRIGVAVSDPTRLIASPVEVIQSVGWGPDSRRVAALCERYETREVLSGLPLNTDGTEGPQARKVRNFCAQLEKLGLIVYYQDERLTTVTAEEALLEANVSRRDRRQVVDKVAATVILQQWLDERREAMKTQEDKHMSDDFNRDAMDDEELEGLEDDAFDGVIELVGDDGETVSFELAGVVEHEGQSYLFMVPLEDVDAEEPEAVVMEVVDDGEGGEFYEAVEDEDLLAVLFERFQEMMEDEGEEG